MTDYEKYKASIIAKNTMNVNEFEHFYPLYNQDALNQLTDEESKILQDEWNGRIDLYTPITIMDDNHNVVVVLPAIFVRPPSLNNLGTDDVTSISNSYNKAMGQSDNPISLLPDIANHQYTEAIHASIQLAAGDIQDKINEFNTLSSNLNITEAEATPFAVSGDGWVDD